MIRKLSATPTAMGTRKLKSESRKHSSADRQKETQRERDGRLVLQQRITQRGVRVRNKGLKTEQEQQEET